MSVPDGTALPAVLKVAGSEEAYQDGGIDGVDALQIQKRYGEERLKRLHEEGYGQFTDISLSEKYKHFQEDPWVDESAVHDIETMFPDNRSKLLILGGGLGGILFATIMIDEAGVRPEDIRIVDIAGGYGGTWYWNRYPGLACDIESYSYLPMLEKTGYIPRHRFSHGEEIRNYANLMIEKWGLTDSGVFQTKAEKLEWDDKAKEWKIELVQQRKEKEPKTLNIRSQFVTTVNGVLNHPKLPNLPGILDYQGHVFHSARWKYDLTGGSPTDPSLVKLRDKRVAIVGTGASSVQLVPYLAKWAKHLYVVQRTPSAVDRRGQRETDPEWFKLNVATGKGWQRERMRNWHEHFTTREKPLVNLVNDGWTGAPGMVAVSGNINGPKTIEELPEYMKELHAIDLPRQNRIRNRVAEVVHNKEWAEQLQPWYPTWCKRPCFHDEYLSSFNLPNVTLIDTLGKGIDSVTADSIVAAGQSYPVDIIIFATGFRAPFLGCPADKANATIEGLNGISMSPQWAANGPSTIHGVLDLNFPNLFLSGPWQATLSGNNLFNLESLAHQAAYILREAQKKAGTDKFSVRPTEEAAQAWVNQILFRSAPSAAIAGCTPGYFNVEGLLDKLPPEGQLVAAKSGLWGWGLEDYMSVVEKWMKEDGIKDIEVSL